MTREYLIDLNSAVELLWTGNYQMVLRDDRRPTFVPAKTFDLTFETAIGTGKEYLQKFETAKINNSGILLGLYTPAGLKEQVVVTDLKIIPREAQSYPADIIKAEVELTTEQIWAFGPIDYSADFGY